MTKRGMAAILAAALLLTACAPTRDLMKKTDEEEIAPPEAPFVLPPPPSALRAPGAAPHLEPLRIEETATEKYIILNFENTDIQTIIATFGELLGINYILTPGITGAVTVQSYRKFPVSETFQIFQTLLEINGLTAIEDGEFYRIIPIDSAKQQPLNVAKGREASLRLDSSFMTQLIPLQNVKAADTANILRALMPRGTDVIVYEPANMLIVTAQPPTLAKFMKIIEALDISEAESEAIRTFVYYVENGKAEKLSEILKAVYTDGTVKATKETAVSTTTAQRTTTARPTIPTRPTIATTSVAASDLPGDLGGVTITAYDDINALIIKATPRTYLSLLEVLKKIDVPPRQVLIEVVIAEMTLSDSSQYGVEWLAKSDRGDTFGFTSTTVESPPVITTSHPGSTGGLFASVVSGVIGSTEYSTVISALEATTRFKVLARPQILAMDNQDAEIKIGKEIPTATSTTESSEGLSTSSQIEYKTVGTILSVTPHITEKGNVSMKLSVEKSDTGSTTTLGSGTYPDFSTNKATTSAVIRDGHTLVIAGLIEEKASRERSGIPWLSKLPFIGYAFGNTDEKTDRVELILMVTPHVLTNQDEADKVAEKYKDRVRVIHGSIRKLDRKAAREETPADGPPLEAEGGDKAETESAPQETVDTPETPPAPPPGPAPLRPVL
jgi:general secretion pathway protein D